jgi:hypothetical protein
MRGLQLHILPQLGTKRLTKITHAGVESSTPVCPSVVRRQTGRLPFSRQFGARRQDIGMWTPPATRPRSSRSIEKALGNGI